MNLPTEHRQAYLTLQTVLQDLVKIVTSNNLDKAELTASLGKVQQCFQNLILSLDDQNLEPSVAVKVQSYLTEIHKQLKLLAMDVQFWQAARQVATGSERKAQMADRLSLLIHYCATLLN